MIFKKKNPKSLIILVCLGIAITYNSGCTKLHEKLNSTLTSEEVTAALGSSGTQLLLSAAYADLAGPFGGPLGIGVLQEQSTDESVIPARGGDWDDNGVWRAIHQHKWNSDHAQILANFNNLNKINFDATNVLAFNPSSGQAAEARFLRAFSLYNLLDLFGQFPVREPGEDLLLPPKVYSGEDAVNFIIKELNEILPDLSENVPTKVSSDAAKVLLMKCYLNKGMFLNRKAPSFSSEDMNQVISIGESIMNSGKYQYTSNYFDNFTPDNNVTSKEAIFTYPNTGGVSVNSSSVHLYWVVTLHYNSWTGRFGDAGWNGNPTTKSFYASFNTTSLPTAFNKSDTVWDTRLGGRVLSNLNSYLTSGIRPGFLVGQQYNELGQPIHDRRGNLLIYNPDLSPDGFETGNTLELGGIRCVKYTPDYQYYAGPAGNDVMIFRYPDVVLMVAEAKMRLDPNDADALALINDLRVSRGANVLSSLPLVNSSNVDDPFTLLAERGRELYWENVRRTDLLRFGVFLVPWDLKPDDNERNLLYPIPTQALAANPNLTQNPGY